MPDQVKNLFYHPSYLEIQRHDQLRIFDNDPFRIVFSVDRQLATSLSRGLFGSVENFGTGTKEAFRDFMKSIPPQLHTKNILQLVLIHPPEFYKGFVPLTWLDEAGFSSAYEDINHHIELDSFQMHAMEKRKLEKLNQTGLVVRELGSDYLPEVYDFLKKCREEKSLELNVSFEKLEALFQLFPKRYSIFGAYLERQLVSAVITVQTTADVVYYYLPGTLERFKKESPMVGLIQHLVDHFKSKVNYLDLGVSSAKGKPQEGLISFKERMGGIKSLKKTYKIRL